MDRNDYLGQRVVRDPMRRNYYGHSEDDNERDTPAGFFIRLMARILDCFIYSVISFIIILFQPNINGLIANVIYCFFYYLILIPLLISSGKRATPGKMIYGLAIERISGKRLGFFRALFREFLIGLIGIFTIFIVFSKSKLALHDIILETRVVRKAVSRKLLVPALFLTVAMGVLYVCLGKTIADKTHGFNFQFSYSTQGNFRTQQTSSFDMHNSLNTNNSKPITVETLPKSEVANVAEPVKNYPLLEEVKEGELGYISVGEKNIVVKDFFVKVVDLHNQGLNKKLAPSYYELQMALYDKNLSAKDRQYLSKAQNLTTGSNSAIATLSIQLVDRLKKCSSSNYRTAKIQIKKFAAGYSNVFTPLSLLEKKRLSINCPDYRDATEILFKMQNTFYRKQGQEIEVNLKIRAKINQ